MTRKLSISLTDDEYDKLMAIEGKTKTDKVRTLLLNKDDNYFTKHFRLESVDKFNFQEQSFIALGVLISLVWEDDVPERVIKNDIPKFNKGNITPLFRSVMEKASQDERYDGLLEFIGEGQLLYLADPLDHERIAYLRVLGQSLSRYYKNEQS